jgi:hypothetical protein
MKVVFFNWKVVLDFNDYLTFKNFYLKLLLQCPFHFFVKNSYSNFIYSLLSSYYKIGIEVLLKGLSDVNFYKVTLFVRIKNISRYLN